MLRQGKLRSKEEERHMVPEVESILDLVSWTFSYNRKSVFSFMHYTDQQFDTEYADSCLNLAYFGVHRVVEDIKILGQ